MDIAALSVVMANNQVKADASLAVMNHVKDLIQQQGEHLVDMMETPSGRSAPHPTLGLKIDQRA